MRSENLLAVPALLTAKTTRAAERSWASKIKLAGLILLTVVEVAILLIGCFVAATNAWP